MSDFKYSINTNIITKTHSREQIVELAQAVGVDGIEWGLPALEEAPAAAREMAKITADHGLEIAGWLNAGRLWNKDLMRKWSEAVAGLGGKTLRVAHPWIAYNFDEHLHQRESFTDIMKKTRAGLEMLTGLHKEYGIRYVVELHSGAVAACPAVVHILMEGLDPAAVGAIYDAANTRIEGWLRPRASAELLGPYLAYVHAKNLIFEKVEDKNLPVPEVKRTIWRNKYCKMDEGEVDWVEVFFALNTVGFSGWISMEEFFRDNPQDQISEALVYLKKCAAAAPDKPQEPYTTFND
jgi:sugar phosphate isomerase/epimerase